MFAEAQHRDAADVTLGELTAQAVRPVLVVMGTDIEVPAATELVLIDVAGEQIAAYRLAVLIGEAHPRGGATAVGADYLGSYMNGHVLLKRVRGEELPVLLELGIDPVVDRFAVLLGQGVGGCDVQKYHDQLSAGDQPDDRQCDRGNYLVRK